MVKKTSKKKVGKKSPAKRKSSSKKKKAKTKAAERPIPEPLVQKDTEGSIEFTNNLVEVAAEYNPFGMPSSSGGGTLLSEFISPTHEKSSTSGPYIKTNTVPTVFGTTKHQRSNETSKEMSPSLRIGADDHQKQIGEEYTPLGRVKKQFSLKDL